MTTPNEQPPSSTQSLWQRMMALLAMVAARVLIWARERQIMAERKGKTILLAAVALLSAGNLAYAQITPSADAYTNTADPTTNFGAMPLLDVDAASQITYIQFNLASIPPGATVSQATLKLYVNAVATPGSFNVDYVNGTWAEGTITSSLAPALGNTIASNVTVTAAQKNQYLLINVTPAVQAWLSASEANDGIALVANNTFNANFDSKENTGTSHAPELDIVFASGEGTITGITTANGSGLKGGGTSGNLNLSLTTGCTASQILQWSGSAWICASAAGTGTITGVKAGTGLTGGGTSGTVTLGVNSSVVPLLGSANIFTATQSINGNVNLPTTNFSGGMGVVMIGGTPFLHNYGASSNTFAGGGGNFTNTGSNLTGIGYGALDNNSSGSNNTALGYDSLSSNSSGNGNTAVGWGSLPLESTGNSNAAVGAGSGQTADSSQLTGSSNTFLGASTQLSTGALSNATAIGANAAVGENNALVLGCVNGVNGCASGPIVGIGTTTPGCYFSNNEGTGTCSVDVTSGNMIVRGNANFKQSGNIAQIDIGDTAHFIGATNGTGIVIGSFNAPTVQIDDFTGEVHLQELSYWSSRRWKTNVQTLHGALDKIEHLRGVTYDETRGGYRHELGFIAEEVGKVVPELVDYEKNGQDARGVDYARVTALLVEATKEQQKLIQKQQRQIKAQQAQIKTQLAQLNAQNVAGKIQQAQLNELASQMKVVQTALKVNGQMNSSALASNARRVE
ncbi:MAG: DNRLRE domain-containing protein [Candidatus Sulfotelmatobacter sp.]